MLLRRFGVWRTTIVFALLAALASMFIASIFMYLLEGGVSSIGLLISASIPLVIAPVSLYSNFNLLYQLDQAEEHIRLLSYTDEMTGVFNRRYFFEQAACEMERSKRHLTSFTIAILDFDNFKDINDTHSHLAGDAAIKRVAQLCLSNLRQIDVFARYGGDEFLFLFPETRPAQAEVCLQRALDAIRRTCFEFDGKFISIRVSIGVSSFRPEMTTLDELLREADFALYAAKRQGGMRVITHRTLTEV